MKKLIYLIAAIAILGLIVSGCSIPLKPVVPSSEESEFDTKKPSSCATIQDGTIHASTGELLTTDYDEFGYNYQAHMFKGRFCDTDRVTGGVDCDVNLIMKWNDAWLSNMDCDGDDLLDLPLDDIGSGAWLTNHQWGSYEDGDGKICNWDYFSKIVAAPVDATLNEGIWYAADGTEIGRQIWVAFAIVQQVENDPCADIHGVQYHSPVGPGFGQF